MVNEVRREYGQIDVLVNNAGVIDVGPLGSHTVDDFRHAMDVMFWGMLHTTLAVIPEMLRRREGRIANITSIGGKVSVPHLVPYSSAKFAAVGFSEGIAAELGSSGIKVTTVVPGLMRTGSHVNAHFKGNHRAEYRWFSLGAANPVTAVDARRAARRVVRAVRRGEAEAVIGLSAKVLALAHGVAPGATVRALSLVNRVLPDDTNSTRHTGHESASAISESALTKFGRSAGKRLNQYRATAFQRFAQG
jgi:short-subunit dehydrogenase